MDANARTTAPSATHLIADELQSSSQVAAVRAHFVRRQELRKAQFSCLRAHGCFADSEASIKESARLGFSDWPRAYEHPCGRGPRARYGAVFKDPGAPCPARRAPLQSEILLRRGDASIADQRLSRAGPQIRPAINCERWGDLRDSELNCERWGSMPPYCEPSARPAHKFWQSFFERVQLIHER